MAGNRKAKHMQWDLGDRSGERANAPLIDWLAARIQRWMPQLTGTPARFVPSSSDSPVPSDIAKSGGSAAAERAAEFGDAAALDGYADPSTWIAVVGTPKSNRRIAEAVDAGLLDLNDLGEDDFLFRTVGLPAEESTQTAVSPKALYIAGTTVRGATYGVCELFERLGFTFLMGKEIPPEPQVNLDVPELDEVVRTKCSWRGIFFGGYCFATNSMMSLPDYQAMFDAMVTLKMNRIVFYHFENEPFIDYSFAGERKLVGDISHPDSGFISYGRHFSGSYHVRDLPVGQEQFDREKIAPQELQHVSTSNEAIDAATGLMRQVMGLAVARGLEVWVTVLPQFTTPNLSKYLRPMSRRHAHWSSHLSCTDPAVGPLNRARIQGILETYPDISGIFLGIPEGFFDDPYPETQDLIESEWKHYQEALSLQREHWGRFWPDEEQQRNHIRADIAFTEILKKTAEEARELKADIKLGVCTVCKAYLLTHLHEILPLDMPFIDIESRALWTLDGAPLHLFQRMEGRETAIIPRAVDDGSLAGLQFPLWQYTQDRFLESAEENGTNGLIIQTTHIRGNEHALRFLAGGMWNGPRTSEGFYAEYAERLFGDAAPAVQEAFALLEENDQAMGGRGGSNMPWNMVPPPIAALRDVRSSPRMYDRSPFSDAGLKGFERRSEIYEAAIPRLEAAVELLASAAQQAPAAGRQEIAYIVTRTSGFRDHLDALCRITAVFRLWHQVFGKSPEPHGPETVAARRGAFQRLVEAAHAAEARATSSAHHFAACVEHTTDRAVLWMISHKMVLGSRCLRLHLQNILNFYHGRDYWEPVPWDILFGDSPYPPFAVDDEDIDSAEGVYEPG